MSRNRTAGTLFAVCAGLAACDNTRDNDPTGPELAPSNAQPQAAELQWAFTRLSNGRGEATAINSKGQVVGFHSVPQGTRAFLWSNGVMRNLGTLGGFTSRAWAINEPGQIVGASTTASGQAHAFLWENGTMRDLGTLGGSFSAATAIESGGRIVGYSQDLDGTTRAFIWENGTMRRLAGLETGFSMAHDIDNMGRVVGRYGSESAPRAFRWVAGRVRDLGTLGGPTAVATAIGPEGKIVGWSITRDGFQRGFLWQNGTMTGLGTLAGGNSSANGISGLSHVVGWSQQPDSAPRAFIWKDGVRSAVGVGSARGVNRNGWVVGSGTVEVQFPLLWRQTTEPPPAGRIAVGTSFFFSERNGSVDLAVDTVAVGTEVTWTWLSGPAVPHSVQSVGTPSFPSSGLMGGFGVTYKVRFTQPGSYRYNCSAHPGNMTGRVVVR
jgi:probable HAF family extracellular repeat protein